MCLRTSLHALTAMSDGKPLCMFGVSPAGLLNGRGTPWLLGTDDMLEYATDLMRYGPRVLNWWFETFSELSNVVSSENAAAIRLLRYWGADIANEPRMIGGLEFVPFVFRAAIQAERPTA